MLVQVALVSQSDSIPSSDVSVVSAALQKQVTRDFGPIWDVEATVDAFETLEDVPLGYWAMVIRDDVREKQQAEGVHLDKDGQPFALIQATDSWAMTASHECLEMLADPFGERLVAGDAPKEAKGQKRVQYLIEVCDPPEAVVFGYTVNDITVSDFLTPNFYDPVASPGVRYSFTGAITKPRTILKGGYLSWHNPPNDHWYQITWFSGSRPALRDLGVIPASSKSTREMIDSMTVTPLMKKAVRKPRPSLMTSTGTAKSAPARAAALQRQIKQLLKK
jgi:hypothetical protein